MHKIKTTILANYKELGWTVTIEYGDKIKSIIYTDFPTKKQILSEWVLFYDEIID